MEIKYTITPNIINQIAQFWNLYGKLTIGIRFIEPTIVDQIKEENNKRASFAATSMDNPANPALLQKIGDSKLDDVPMEKEQSKNFLNYLDILNNLPKYFVDYKHIDIDLIEQLIIKLTPNKASSSLRKTERVLTFQELQNGMLSNVQKRVKTTPSEIKQLLDDFVTWIQAYANITNPLILAAITHIKIAEIHPFEDGNGRLSRIMARGIMHIGGMDLKTLLDFNSFYYLNKNNYFDLIEKGIQNNDITTWIEFFLQGAVESITNTMVKISNLTGGSIDLLNNKIAVLTPREQKIIALIYQLHNASGTEIARELKVSRQNIHMVLHKLEKLNILKKIGKNTSVRYTLF